MKKEIGYKDLSETARKGFGKYSSLSSRGMMEYADKYRNKTKKNPYNIFNKEHFFSWVARNRIRANRR